MNKFKKYLGAAWGFTKEHGVTILRGVAVLFIGRKVGRVAGQSAETLDKVLREVNKK